MRMVHVFVGIITSTIIVIAPHLIPADSPHPRPQHLCVASLQVVELKGNIRVLARIRPLLEKERVSSDGSAAVLPVQATSAETLLMAGTTGQSKEYEFDRVFGPQEGQEQVND
jgi:hypothetical protein